jgi:hypothetical protein
VEELIVFRLNVDAIDGVIPSETVFQVERAISRVAPQ